MRILDNCTRVTQIYSLFCKRQESGVRSQESGRRSQESGVRSQEEEEEITYSPVPSPQSPVPMTPSFEPKKLQTNNYSLTFYHCR
ncbi:hypothetical protein [Dolichospermum sp. UHCC 0259]|uniref:hypothetical protein n=1 Tax=Dolichospermum sp. UHCC 0259 TaxID=2590010 RepID=UPI001446BAC0|nr:hypothetical protein [Dolichospermum sp. UHCC 0259]MTJ49016.1 hypothetical protein [Dolichospermum sp. UHCC 0259]